MRPAAWYLIALSHHLLNGISDGLLRRLQSVQHTAALLITVRPHQPATPCAPLATTSSTYPVQDRRCSLPGAGRSSTRVPCRLLPFGVKYTST